MFKYILLIEQLPEEVDAKELNYVDTTIRIPHVECYHIKNGNELWVEEICGREYILGHVHTATDSLQDLENYLKEVSKYE